MTTRYETIIAGERAFARRVALAVIVTRETSAAHFVIPFMFIFDFIARTRAIRKYSHRYLQPRRLALDAANAIVAGSDREETVARIKTGLVAEQALHDPESELLLEHRMQVIRLLVENYVRLLQTEGKDYNSMIRHAYPDRDGYEAFLTQLTSAEKSADLLMAEISKVLDVSRGELEAEHRHLEMQREKDLVILY